MAAGMGVTQPRWLALFDLQGRGSSLRTELRAGLTTFSVMAYIIFVNPLILTFAGVKGLEGKGPPFAATVTATCLVAGVTSILMGVWTNYPFALAPGLGINAVVAFQLIAGMGLPWQAAMGVIVLEGLVLTILVLTSFRQAMMEAMPLSLKYAIGVGIGLFILFIGLYQAGFVRVPLTLGAVVSAPPAEPLTLGNLTTLPIAMALLGLALTVALLARRVRGALLAGILLTTLIAMLVHAVSGHAVSSTPGKAVLPQQWAALPDFSTFGKGLDFSIFTRVSILTAVVTIFSIMLSDFFDTFGTAIAIGGQGGWLDQEGRLPRLFPVLMTDALAAMFGGIASSSSATTYIESAAGVAEGGRTGLTVVVTGLLFLLALFVAPIAGVIPPEATAAALIVVGFSMCGAMRQIAFTDFSEGFPALLTIIVMPLSYSITNGIGAGFVSYGFIKLVTGRVPEVHWMLWLATIAFVIYFALPWLEQSLGF